MVKIVDQKRKKEKKENLKKKNVNVVNKLLKDIIVHILIVISHVYCKKKLKKIKIDKIF